MRPGVFPGCRHCRGLGSGVALSAAALLWRFSGLAPVAKCAAAPGAPRRCARLDHICLGGAASVAALASPGCAAPAPGCAVPSPCGRPCMGCQPAVFRLLALPAQGAAWVGGWSVHPAGKPGAACVGGVGFGSRVGAALVPALHLARLLSRSRSTRHPVCEGASRRLGRCSRPWCLGAPAPFASVALARRASRPPGGLRLCGFFLLRLGRVDLSGAGLRLRCPPSGTVLSPPRSCLAPGVSSSRSGAGKVRVLAAVAVTARRADLCSGRLGRAALSPSRLSVLPVRKAGACSVRVRRRGHKPPRGAAPPCWRGAASGGVPASAPGG